MEEDVSFWHILTIIVLRTEEVLLLLMHNLDLIFIVSCFLIIPTLI